jgi:hypothetical protein
MGDKEMSVQEFEEVETVIGRRKKRTLEAQRSWARYKSPVARKDQKSSSLPRLTIKLAKGLADSFIDTLPTNTFKLLMNKSGNVIRLVPHREGQVIAQRFDGTGQYQFYCGFIQRLGYKDLSPIEVHVKVACDFIEVHLPDWK